MSMLPAQTDAPARTRRMTLSDVVEHLLQRGSTGQSSVALTRNAKGETQIEVVVRTGDTGEVLTVTDAETVATAVYDRLRTKYPTLDAAGGAS
jgi:hypothetical protein